MKRVPPKPVRRLVVAPLVAAVEVTLLLLSPVLLVLAALAAPVAGGSRAARAVVVLVAFARLHLAALVEVAGLSVWAAVARPRPERVEDAGYGVMRRFVAGVHDVLVHQARVTVAVEAPDEAARALGAPGRPLVVLGRHAGEGDTLLVVHELLRHGRRPRIVMHEALRLDPLIDVLGDRLPNRFVDPRGGDTEREIAAMARKLDDRSALVIFPEGVNFSPRARARAIERLEQAGRAPEAEIARGMAHVSAPRPGGALAAIDAAQDADVVVLGHAGFPAGLPEAWRLLPERQAIQVRLWHEERGSIPEDHGERIRWLFERWQHLDRWVAERAPGPPG